MQPTRFCIIRHGETAWNTERRVQGHIDIALNEAGQRQAVAAARGVGAHALALRFAALYSSDLERTQQTAAALAGAVKLDVRLEPGLRERHFGRMQGATYDEMLQTDPAEAQRFRQRDPHHDFGGGETLLGFARRIETTVERLAAAHGGETVLLVTHGGVLDIIYRRAVGRDLRGPRDFPVPNAALNWVEVSPAGWHLIDWADQRHLDGALDEVQ